MDVSTASIQEGNSTNKGWNRVRDGKKLIFCMVILLLTACDSDFPYYVSDAGESYYSDYHSDLSLIQFDKELVSWTDLQTFIGSHRNVDTGKKRPPPRISVGCSEANELLKFGSMFAPRLFPLGVVGEDGGVDSDLGGNEVQQSGRYCFIRNERSAGMPQQTELQRKAKFIAVSSFGQGEHDVVAAQRVMPYQAFLVRRDADKCTPLICLQQRTICHMSASSRSSGTLSRRRKTSDCRAAGREGKDAVQTIHNFVRKPMSL